MTSIQSGILADLPSHGRYLEFSLDADANLEGLLDKLKNLVVDENLVIGLGPALVKAAKGDIQALRPFPALSGPGCNAPSTQQDLWVWLRGIDRGDLFHQGRELENLLFPDLNLENAIDGFKYKEGRDLTGYVDGTENPEGEAAVDAVKSDGGASFVAVQQWVHDLDTFQTKEQSERDHIIGRRLSDNEELDDAPVSAHVKRTAQESFDPEAFVLRRSMPWSEAGLNGLMFVAFGKDLDAFEAQMKRMIGEEDGITDALFTFSKPVTGGYFWCPAVIDGKLDLSALG